VFAVAEYRALWLAMVLSLVGDQIAVVALTWLVYDASSSPLLAAVTCSISYLPWIVGGPLLSGLADRVPRRELRVACDVARAGLVLALLVPGVPLWGLCVLLFATEMLSPPFTAARAALMPDVLPDDRYVLGTAIGNVTQMVGQFAGFAGAGLLVAILAPAASLALNAVTFLVSGALIWFGVRRRPAARGEPAAVGALFTDAAAGLRLVLGRRDLRTLAGLGLLCLFYVVPEGLAVPYARELGGGAVAAGFLLAAAPFGSAVGGLVFGRLVAPARRLRLMAPLAFLACAVLVLCALGPSLPVVLAVLTASGHASAYQLAANAAFVSAVPPEARGQAFGLVQAALSVGQGLAIVAAGAFAHLYSPAWVIAAAGALGAAAAAGLAVSGRGAVTP
jgi:MFS family permease